MKRLSIKAQLTLYYGIVMSLLIAGILLLLYVYSSYEVTEKVESALISQVQNATNDIVYKNHQIQYGNDLMRLDDGVYLSILDEDHEILYGRVPYGFELQEAFHEEIKRVTFAEETYLVLDMPYFPDGRTKLMVRGIVSFSAARSSMIHVFRFSLIILPAVLIICLLIGYLQAKRALSPVSTITSKVKDIIEHKGPRLQIALGEGKDEIYEMASTFDTLLSNLHDVIHREKQFTSDVSHELRTPISVILAQCELLLEEDTLTKEQRHQIQIIQKKARSMHQMIAQLLMLSRADAGTAKFDMEEIDFSELAIMCTEDQSYHAETKQIQIIPLIDSDISLIGDQTLLIRLLVNLISNAITYGKENGYVKVLLNQTADQVHLCVEDNGIGISETDLPLIFNRFYQADHSRTSSHSGLGLSMVKWIAEVHHAEIKVESELGKGTSFHLYFPKEEH